MAIENIELRLKCCPQHFCIETARIKEDNKTEKVMKRRVNMEINKQVPDNEVSKAQLIAWAYQSPETLLLEAENEFPI